MTPAAFLGMGLVVALAFIVSIGSVRQVRRDEKKHRGE